MPVLINEVISEFQSQNRPTRTQHEAPADNAAPGTGPDLTELLELQALQRSREQRLEVD